MRAQCELADGTLAMLRMAGVRIVSMSSAVWALASDSAMLSAENLPIRSIWMTSSAASEAWSLRRVPPHSGRMRIPA